MDLVSVLKKLIAIIKLTKTFLVVKYYSIAVDFIYIYINEDIVHL